MSNFDFESKKISIIIFVIFVVFALLIIKAFDYLPQDENGSTRNADINKVLESKAKKTVDEEQANQEQDVEQQENNARNGFDVDLSRDVNQPLEESKPVEEEKLEPIGESSESVQSGSALSETDVKILNAQKLRDEKQYVRAIEEFNSIAENTSEIQVKAKCYEEVANIYGILKRYGTALSYAQKAYNSYPTSSREMLLARLYYKTGDLDNATKRMNNVLQRDFVNDRD